MGKRNISLIQRNHELEAQDHKRGRNGRLRLHTSTPEYWSAKQKVDFECLDCGTGRGGGWAMQIHNAKYGKGCPICKAISEVKRDLEIQYPSVELRSIVLQSGPPSVCGIRYRLIFPNAKLSDEFGQTQTTIAQAAIKKALTKGVLPMADALKHDAQLQKILETFKHSFPNAIIQYVGKTKQGSTSPGPFFRFETGQRALREPKASESMSSRGILRMCMNEESDKELKESLRLHAKEFGATIIGFRQSKSGALIVHYRSRTGYAHHHTVSRAKGSSWGQSGFKKAETLALIVVAELLPTNDWLRNARPDFLCQESGYNLELDGYSPSLKLGVEYQGIQHYQPRSDKTKDQNNFLGIVRRDKIKRELCAAAGITLIEIRDMPLSVDHFFERISRSLKLAGMVSTNASPSLSKIRERFDAACKNPLAAFQQRIEQRLGNHQIVNAGLAELGKLSTLSYRCGNCNALNDATAAGYAFGHPRRFCPKCKGEYVRERRRANTMAVWRRKGVPDEFLRALRSNDVGGKPRYEYVCPREHVTRIHGPEHALRHINDGKFSCPRCVADDTNANIKYVARLSQHRESLSKKVNDLGLRVCGELSYDADGQMIVEVECGEGHRFTVKSSRISLMLKNTSLNDRRIVPSACPACCYPGVQYHEFHLLRSTIFHRLKILRGMYPNVEYRSGFDPTSWGLESYTCGRVHSDRTLHPPIRISFRNLQRNAKRSPTTHLCAACGLEEGQVVGGRKSCADIKALMKVMQDEIRRRARSEIKFAAPAVNYVSGEISEDGIINTCKTRLEFWCGVAEHRSIVSTKDYYFNRAAARGSGFCPECVNMIGERKAPLPRVTSKPASLRALQYRDWL